MFVFYFFGAKTVSRKLLACEFNFKGMGFWTEGWAQGDPQPLSLPKELWSLCARETFSPLVEWAFSFPDVYNLLVAVSLLTKHVLRCLLGS